MITSSYRISATLFGAVATIVLVQSPSVTALEPTEISRIAKEFTVRIEGADTGSGVIIERNGNIYTVLTNWHVVDYKGKYQVVTPDGKKHDFTLEQVTYLPGIDLAKVEFTSEQNYTVAEFGNSEAMSEGALIYMAGYPDASVVVTESLYRCESAEVISLLRNPEDGYALVFDKIASPGMSGGAILDNNARLIGINGRGKIDINVNRAFGFAIPIQTFIVAQNDFQIPPNNLPQESVADTGTRLLREEKYEEAIETFNQALEEKPNDSILFLYQQGVAYRESGNYPAWIENFNRVIEVNPQDSFAYINRGQAYFYLGQHQKAIDDFNQAILINPQYPDGYNNRGNVYAYLEQYQKALEDYNQAIKLNPNSFAFAYNNRGLTYDILGQYQKAIADFNQAIQINPQFAEVYVNRGRTYARLGQYQEEIENYNQAIQINPRLAEAYFNLGHVYKTLGNQQKAIENFRRAAELFQQQGRTADYQRAINLINQLD